MRKGLPAFIVFVDWGELCLDRGGRREPPSSSLVTSDDGGKEVEEER